MPASDEEKMVELMERARTKFASEFTRIEPTMKVLCWKCFKWTPEEMMVDLPEGWTCSSCAKSMR